MPVKFVIKLIDWLIICSFMYTNTNANTNTAKWIMHPGDSIISYSPDWLASSPGTNLFWAFFALPLHSLRASWLSLVEHQNNSSHCWLFSPFFFVFPSFPLFSLVLFFFDFRLRRPSRYSCREETLAQAAPDLSPAAAIPNGTPLLHYNSSGALVWGSPAQMAGAIPPAPAPAPAQPARAPPRLDSIQQHPAATAQSKKTCLNNKNPQLAKSK